MRPLLRVWLLDPPIGMGIGALMGQYGGKKGSLQGALLGGLGGLGADYFNKAGTFSPGRFGDKFLGGFDEMVAGKLQQGTGLKGTAQNILQALTGGGGGEKTGIAKLLSNDKNT